MPDDFGIDKKSLAYVLILVLTGNAGVVWLNKANPDMRADAFTATEAKELKDSLIDQQKDIKIIYAIQQTMLHRMSEREKTADKILQRLRALERRQ